MKSKIIDEICIIELDYPQIDALNISNFQSNLKEHMKHYKKILLDFSNTRFIDSSGLGILLGLFRTLNQKNGVMSICSMNSAVSTLFEMVKLPEIIPCFDTRDKALQYLKSE